MNSIRGRLILCLLGGVILLEIAAGMGLFAYVEETLEHSLDAALLANADAIAGAVHLEDGQPRLESSKTPLSESAHHDGPFYFQIWRGDGSSLARFGPAASNQSLPRLGNPHRRFGDIVLPGGAEARAIELNFSPKAEEDEENLRASPRDLTGETLTLVVAHDRRSIDQPLAVLLTGLLVTALLLTAGIIAIVNWGVRRGLRPLAQLAKQVEQIGPTTLQLRCPEEGLPQEIRPITQKVNNLLHRLEEAFVRERRFSADVAHELRTPLAELRSLCEVSLRWPEGCGAETVAESLTIAKQMEETVGSLLSLIRIQAGVETPRLEEIDLIETIRSVWKPLEQAAQAKRLRVDPRFPQTIVLRTDRRIFTQALRNLLANAVQHTPPEGTVVIEALQAAKDAAVWIRNTNVSLDPDDISHLCEPFWRKDSARTDHSSSGLGLTIVDEYCRAIGARLRLRLVERTWFEAGIAVEGAIVDPDVAELGELDQITMGAQAP
jgi:two-component system sensor histidine kinase QseC